MGTEKHSADVADRSPPSPSDIDAEKTAQTLPHANKQAQKVLAHSHDADEAMKAFESGEVIEIDEATNKRLLRRIDLHMLPLM